VSFLLVSSSFASDYYNRANEAAAKALDDLDCEFEDCKKEEAKPKVIIKEKIVEKPVIVEKEVVVEKIVYRDKPAEATEEVKVEKAVNGAVYNKAFFDVHAKSQAPMLDYIKYSNRASFDINQYIDTVAKIKEKGTKVYIHGRVEVPSSITTPQVYMNVGKNYDFKYYNYWAKHIYYNDSKNPQSSDYFLVDVKTDSAGNRYVKYKIYFYLNKPWALKASEENVAPNVYFFKMAPKTRGFKNKFVTAKPYIIEE
jgi:hypothetical protein